MNQSGTNQSHSRVKSFAAWFKKPNHLLDITVLAALIIVSLVIWYPTRYFPYHWDSAGYIADLSHQILDSNFQNLVYEELRLARPPLLSFLLALVWKLTQQSIVASHLLMFPFLPLLGYSTYLIGKRVISSLSGILVMFLVIFTPFVLAEYGILYVDLPAASLATLAIALWLSNRKITSMIFFTLGLLFKEFVIILLPMFLYWQYKESKPQLKKQLNSYYIFAIPLGVLALWLAFHYLQAGWIVSANPGQALSPYVTSPIHLYNSINGTLSITFYRQFRWLFSLSSLIALGYLLYAKVKLKSLDHSHTILGFIISLSLSLIYYILSTEYAERYGIFMLPLIFTIGIWLLFHAAKTYQPSKTNLIVILLTVPVLLGFIYSWHPRSTPRQTYNFRAPADLSYQDIILLNRQLGAYLQTFSPSATIYGSFPENLYLVRPYLGYVSQPMAVNACDQFTLKEDVLQLIVIHPYSPGQQICRQLLDLVPVTPVQRFQSTNEWLELYEVTASASAQVENTPT